MTVTVRPMMPQDVTASCRILNAIIEAGGTTALEVPLTETLFSEYYLTGSDFVCCHVAVDVSGEVAGFQWLGVSEDLPPDCANIASFARQAPKVPGTGRALFEITSQTARDLGFSQINATIRADNVPGLSYYSKMGFEDHSVLRAHPLESGKLVDRISKRYQLISQ